MLCENSTDLFMICLCFPLPCFVFDVYKIFSLLLPRFDLHFELLAFSPFSPSTLCRNGVPRISGASHNHKLNIKYIDHIRYIELKHVNLFLWAFFRRAAIRLQLRSRVVCICYAVTAATASGASGDCDYTPCFSMLTIP